jgi:hypothetical protein
MSERPNRIRFGSARGVRGRILRTYERTDVEIGSGYLSSNRPNVRARITGFARMFRADDCQARSADALVPGKQPIRELLPSPHDTTTQEDA